MDINEFISKFADAVEIEDASCVKPTTKFRELDEWDSAATLSIMVLVDEEFGFEIDPDEIRNARTIEDLYNICVEKHGKI